MSKTYLIVAIITLIVYAQAQAYQEHRSAQGIGNTDGVQSGIKIRKSMNTDPAGDAQQGTRNYKKPAGQFNDDHFLVGPTWSSPEV